MFSRGIRQTPPSAFRGIVIGGGIVESVPEGGGARYATNLALCVAIYLTLVLVDAEYAYPF